jgi:hypothetical protein
MRRCLCLVALGVLGLAWVAEGWGQGTSRFLPAGSRASTMNGSARRVINTPVDTSLAIAPFPTQKGSFFSSLFRKPTLPSFPAIAGQSNLPSPSSFKSTKYPNTFKPLPPIIPGQK